MKKKVIFMALFVTAGACVLLGFQNMDSKKSPDKTGMPDLKSWPEASQLAAKDMMKKYGKPDESTSSMLLWNNNGPWKRTKILNKESAHSFPVDHTDVMEQTISYDVPIEMFSKL